MANLSVEEPYALVRARTDLWEPRGGNAPGPPGPTQRKKTQPSTSNIGEADRRCTQFEYGQEDPRTSGIRIATPRNQPRSVRPVRASPVRNRLGLPQTRARSAFAAEMGDPPGRGERSFPSVSHSWPIFTSSRDFDSETGIWDSETWSYDRKRLGQVLHRQSCPF